MTLQSLGASLRSIETLRNHNPRTTAFMAQRAKGNSGTVPKPRWCSWQAISGYVICAVVHSEDPLFFRHRGFWWEEMRRQVRQNLRSKQPVRGVSTISQQLARNLFLHPQRSLGRKLSEALITAHLEHALSKTRILELYLNVAEWGPNIWGIEEAAAYYFGSSAANLGAFESIFLASILPAPRTAVEGSNARRVIRSQRRLASLFYGSGVISWTCEKRLYGQIDSLDAVISQRGDIASFLRATMIPDESATGAALSAPNAIAMECGIGQRGFYEQFLRGSVSYVRGVSVWPEWWSPST
jgi:monofunctional biosynthetic peptidoglycan transglycosylase